MFCVNKQVACEPFPEQKGVKAVNTALKIAAHNNTLVGLKVVMGEPIREDGLRNPYAYEEGDTVFVRGAMSAHQFAKEVFVQEDINGGKPFILVPTDFIALIKKAG